MLLILSLVLTDFKLDHAPFDDLNPCWLTKLLKPTVQQLRNRLVNKQVNQSVEQQVTNIVERSKEHLNKLDPGKLERYGVRRQRHHFWFTFILKNIYFFYQL
jgi:hypothetical protein